MIKFSQTHSFTYTHQNLYAGKKKTSFVWHKHVVLPFEAIKKQKVWEVWFERQIEQASLFRCCHRGNMQGN